MVERYMGNDGISQKTTSKIVMPWSAFAPKSCKIGTLVYFIRRAYTNSSGHKQMHTELNFIEDQFSCAGYPNKIIKEKIRQTIAIMGNYNPAKPKYDDDKSHRWIVLHLQWAGEAAEAVYKRIFKQVPATICRVTIAWSSVKLYALLPRFIATTPSTPEDAESSSLKSIYLQSDLIYKYSCDCGCVYVGETMRRLEIRIKEHQTKKSSIQLHLNECGSVFDRGKFSVLAKGLKGKLSRKKYETLFIKFYMRRDRCMNTCETSRNLTIF